MRSGQHQTFQHHEDVVSRQTPKYTRTLQHHDVLHSFSAISSCFWLVVEPISISGPVGCRPARNLGRAAVFSFDVDREMLKILIRAKNRVHELHSTRSRSILDASC